ncbi:MAG TPA: hypothetical protein VMA09_21480 [Candidatus Binataceae bacterium]|nr:hypothetical protein [Candidatus Binataceae bacterium]
MNARRKLNTIFAALAVAAAVSVPFSYAGTADNLKLAPDLSFTDDSSANFPIVTNPGDAAGPVANEATVIFFGTAHCWNTNREAERLVALYPKYRGKMHFVIVDLNNVSADQKPLVAKYYRGAIPTIAIVDSSGHVIYDRAGETAADRGDTSNLQSLLNSAH